MISTAYNNALKLTEELWEMSKILPHATRHSPDRIEASNLKLGMFDTLWTLQKKGQATEQAVLDALMDWWTDLTAILEDCAPLAGMARKGSRMVQERRLSPRAYQATQQELMPF